MICLAPQPAFARKSAKNTSSFLFSPLFPAIEFCKSLIINTILPLKDSSNSKHKPSFSPHFDAVLNAKMPLFVNKWPPFCTYPFEHGYLPAAARQASLPASPPAPRQHSHAAPPASAWPSPLSGPNCIAGGSRTCSGSPDGLCRTCELALCRSAPEPRPI